MTPELGKQCADAFLYNDFGSGWEWWTDFDKFHQIAIDELNAFDYEEYKKNGFKVKQLGDGHCELYDRPEGFSSVPLMVKRWPDAKHMPAIIHLWYIMWHGTETDTA